MTVNATSFILELRGCRPALKPCDNPKPRGSIANAYEGRRCVPDKLLAAGADLSAKNKQGLTALDLAKNYDHRAIANLLTAKAAGR